MIIDILKQHPIIPVLRKIPYEKSQSIIQALYDGGIRAVEVTMESEGAVSIIEETLELFPKDLLVGAGTVLSKEDCQRAIDAGAQFIVSPVLDEAVMQYAIERNVPFIPGAFTPSEMVKAHNGGAAMIKLFPASVLGPSFIKDVKGPLSHIDIMTTGGITMETAKTYLDAGAKVVGAGSALIRKDLVDSNDWASLTAEAISWVTLGGR
ncbi:bifunctional 4-hydroxy-2-oxoglutarate aldolase/2-dehydro-3-deoxy-phosphogluconate aldolase [Sporosarcina sp. FSL K6-2383]|uniref:bifunctional 4-hydroxy-2-oxoglutarate aldolase/2-dehydro-3-deoxy-phosphogluconate aldolase n=1 Tax=Sporosarcina sp. FSL K6-2383 TaxID=2921556 RepID=UPI00315AE522